MSVYKLFGSAGSDTDGLAQLDVQFDGHIVAWYITATAAAADGLGDGFEIEVSFLSGSMFVNNDARGIIAMASAIQNFLTTGGAGLYVNTGMSGLSIPVNAGERIFMHYNGISAPGATLCHAILYVEDSSDPLLRRRR